MVSKWVSYPKAIKKLDWPFLEFPSSFLMDINREATGLTNFNLGLHSALTLGRQVRSSHYWVEVEQGPRQQSKVEGWPVHPRFMIIVRNRRPQKLNHGVQLEFILTWIPCFWSMFIFIVNSLEDIDVRVSSYYFIDKCIFSHSDSSSCGCSIRDFSYFRMQWERVTSATWSNPVRCCYKISQTNRTEGIVELPREWGWRVHV